MHVALRIFSTTFNLFRDIFYGTLLSPTSLINIYVFGTHFGNTIFTLFWDPFWSLSVLYLIPLKSLISFDNNNQGYASPCHPRHLCQRYIAKDLKELHHMSPWYRGDNMYRLWWYCLCSRTTPWSHYPAPALLHYYAKDLTENERRQGPLRGRTTPRPFSKHMRKIVLPLKLWIPAASEVRWSRTVS